MTQQQQQSYYDILELALTASPLEIKKSYRRLALQHHPDRNPADQQEASTEKFKHIGQAYEVLSDPDQKAAYDRQLKFGGGGGPASQGGPASTTATSTSTASHHHHFRTSNKRTNNNDPFAQFNHLFRTDPFFQEAFADMDEEFAKRFSSSATNATTTTGASATAKSQSNNNNNSNVKEGWGAWLLRQCGVNFQMTSYTSDGRGGMTASKYSNNKTNTSQQTTRTFVDRQGQRVTVRSMMKNGDQLQDTYIGNQLTERQVNGSIVPISTISQQQQQQQQQGDPKNTNIAR